MEDNRQLYQFRWSNIDLDDFVKRRRFVANGFRRDAEILMRRAEQIDEEADQWERALEESTPPTPEAAR